MKYSSYIVLFITLLIIVFVGYQVGERVDKGLLASPFHNIIGGIITIAVFWFLVYWVKKITVRSIAAVFFGLFIGLILSYLLNNFLDSYLSNFQYWYIIKIFLTFLFCYLGVLIMIKAKEEFNLAIPYVNLVGEGKGTQVILLDTSVIIDGRVVEIVNAGFLEGKFFIPRFILKELQHIADSQDSLKRNRGRRGLDVLNKIKSSSNVEVSIQDQDFPEIKEVDAKLVKLAKISGAKILTNDYNLNKVAELQGIEVLNINELANALKPVVLPGEHMEVKLVKKGKEDAQALAYLEDGTMVVVDDARHLIGKTIEVEITSVLQTSAGRMIFGTPSDKKK